jgi:HAD superfamily hydrolase (TIGR01490 family)
MSGRVAAFFDVDHTLIEVNSGRKYIEHLWKHDEISVADALKAIWWLAQYRLSLLDYDAATAEVVKGYAGQKLRDIEAKIGQWYREEIEPTICKESYERIAWHKQRGHVTVMLTSGATFSTEPLREHLGIDHLVCTQIEVVDGELTGNYFPPACYGQGKLDAARELAATEDLDLEQSWFYTDSYSDLPMLEAVAHPVVVNPDPRLRRHALHVGWGYDLWKA